MKVVKADRLTVDKLIVAGNAAVKADELTCLRTR